MSRTERAPAFQCYAADVLADAQSMTDDEFGKYWRLAMIAWRDRGIENDLARIAVKLRVPAKRFAALWAVIGAPFVEQDGRLVLPWMEAQRERQEVLRQRSRENGKNGGRPASAPNGPNSPNPDVTQEEPSGFGLGNPDHNLDESVSSYRFPVAGCERDSAALSGRADNEPDTSTPTEPDTPDAPDAPETEPAADARDAAERALRARLPSSYWLDLSALLADRPTTARRSWCAELGALLDGMHGPVVAPEKLGEALREFVANGGGDPGKGVRLFKNGYLPRVLAPPRAPPDGAMPGPALSRFPPQLSAAERLSERSRQNTRVALAALKDRSA